MTSYTTPSCATGSDLTTKFNNAKSYSTQNRNLMGQMINDLSGDTANTLTSKYSTIRTKFASAFTDFESIKLNLDETL